MLHGPLNIGGGTWRLVEAERRLGIDSHMLTFRSSWPGMESGGECLHFEKRSRPGRIAARITGFARLLWRFDVFHFYWGDSFIHAPHLGVQHWDFDVLRALGKKIAMTFQGCDIRQKDQFLKEFDLCACSFCEEECGPRKQRRKALNVEKTVRCADAVFVSTPDLLSVLPLATLLPQTAPRLSPVDNYSPPPEGGPMRVLHSPTHRAKKGTNAVLRAVERLREEGIKIELVLNEGLSWERNIEAMRGCHLVLDQLCGGWYGYVSVEAMAMGLPVICHLREDLKARVPYGRDIPIIGADVYSIEEVLRRCSREPGMLAARAARGPAFVSEWHDADAHAGITAAAYGFEAKRDLAGLVSGGEGEDSDV